VIALLCLVLSALAQEDPWWLSPEGAGGLSWGTSEQPVGAVARPRDFYLPDAGFVGRDPNDRPEDLELPQPHGSGERRFMRYVHGALVDAWVVREGNIDTSAWERLGEKQWQGTILGPADGGWRAYGDATSWQVGQRTALWWRDRSSKREILVSRAPPSGQYGVRRDAPLAPGLPGTQGVRLRGTAKDWLKPWEGPISGCLEHSPKPVAASIHLLWDAAGRPSRIRADADQPAFELITCMAAAVSQASAPPGSQASAEAFRLR
jgi:hypothetical protein